NPAHLSSEVWARGHAFLASAKKRGELVDFSSRGELLTPAEVAGPPGMSRATALRRIADGDIQASTARTHPRNRRNEHARYSGELMRRMAEVSAADIEAELFGE